MDIEEQLRAAIQKARASGDINQRQIALKAGVDVGILSRFVRGEQTITLANAAKLAAVLKLSLKR